MNMNVLKKTFPQFVINGLIGLAIIFIFALIGVLHTKHANAEEKVVPLDWKELGFIEKLTEQCPRLAAQEPDVFNIAVKYGNAGDERREDIEATREKLMNRGVSAVDAQRSAEAAAFFLRPTVSSPWMSRKLFGPRPPEGMPASEWTEWFAAQERLKVEKKQQFMNALIRQCPQLPMAVLNLSYRETFVLKKEKTQ